MIAAFFADDLSASHAALLASTAYNRRSIADDPTPSLVIGGERIVAAVPTILDAARSQGRDLMVALPLAHLGDRAIRCRVDAVVVSFGAKPWAARAAREAVAADAGRDLAPPWLLPCCASARPAGLRALPVSLGTLRRSEAATLLAGEPSADLRLRAVGLAAALHLAAEDPYAARLDPGHLRALLAGAETAAELRLRASLLELAADLDDELPDPVGLPTPRIRVERPVPGRRSRLLGRRRPKTVKPQVAPRQAAGCACAVPA
ncbi:hypothetical protein [Methylobacterium gregans]|uniref:Uncharacterized protein n=1 Tax=Methylobacterium gregans TaxID=374424 RepID=A0AA37M9L7_9HYPH|nr:hypothetical protein [Methylobacterium gregans]MDQ0520648.1 hypothetical protein [Methylobacterium gregans]GJD77492.1 hypothetical protein NBEOAGPD_0697 [Methylobacterium gregans]GLS53403.1 hypothetical protein GCM10007886_15860 [Methylobacterium gregans]